MGNFVKFLLGMAFLAYWKKRKDKSFTKTDVPDDGDYIDLGGNYKMPTSAWENPKLWGKIELRPPWGVKVHKGKKRINGG